jgi:hypothetical protein
VRSATTCAARVNTIYMRVTANARVTGSFSLVVEAAKVMMLAKSTVIGKRSHKDLYSKTQEVPYTRDTSTQMKKSLKDFYKRRDFVPTMSTDKRIKLRS